MGFELILTRVSFLAEGAEKGAAGCAGGIGLCGGESETALNWES